MANRDYYSNEPAYPPQASPYNNNSPYPQQAYPQQGPPQQQYGYAPPQQQDQFGFQQPQQQPYGAAPYQYPPQGAPNPTSFSDNRSYNDPNMPPPGSEGPEGERGIGATLLGGTAGGFVAHEVGGGMLTTAVGAIVGAIGANALEHRHKQHKQEQEWNAQQQQYGPPRGLAPPSPGYYGGQESPHHHHHHHHHHSRHGSREPSPGRY